MVTATKPINTPVDDPTPAQICERCREIQERWSHVTRWQRSGYKGREFLEAAPLKVVTMHLDNSLPIGIE